MTGKTVEYLKKITKA